MAAPNFWDNPDGLRVHFNRRNTENNIPSESANPSNARKVVEFIFRGEALVDVAASVNVDRRSAYIPAGAVIESSKLIVSETFVGATAVLDVGTHGVDDGAIVDDDGLHAAVAVASLVANAVLVGAGAQVGTRVTEALYVVASFDTAAFTAGAAKLVVEYIEPAVQTT